MWYKWACSIFTPRYGGYINRHTQDVEKRRKIVKIIKRNKSEVEFNVNKIAVAVAKANAVVPEGEKLT